MANEQNLKPFDLLTEKEQREIRSKGGKASVKAKKEKKDFLQKLQWAVEQHGDNIIAAMIAQAEDGNITATKEILDRLYGKAKEHLEANVTTQEQPPEGLEEMYKRLKADE